MNLKNKNKYDRKQWNDQQSWMMTANLVAAVLWGHIDYGLTSVVLTKR